MLSISFIHLIPASDPCFSLFFRYIDLSLCESLLLLLQQFVVLLLFGLRSHQTCYRIDSGQLCYVRSVSKTSISYLLLRCCWSCVVLSLLIIPSSRGHIRIDSSENSATNITERKTLQRSHQVTLKTMYWF